MSDVEQWMTLARAFCQDCDWSVESNNAQGVAAQHADKYGHEVKGELAYSYHVTPEQSSTGTDQQEGDR
jgi:hypothetical protein